MDKKTVAHVLHEIGVLLELKGENAFKARAFYNGARTVENIKEDLKALIDGNSLSSVKGIGKSLAQVIEELYDTGTSQVYQELKESIPEGLMAILGIPGLGPKKVTTLYQTLGISNIGELEYACKENRLIDLPGFGLKSQQKVLDGIEQVKKYQGKWLYPFALIMAEEILDHLREFPQVEDINIAGSLRRKKEIIKDIDIITSSQEPNKVIEAFISLPQVEQVIGAGDTKASVTLHTGINVDLRVVKPEEFPYALHHLTGSKEHNTLLRGRAKAMSMKINEYGLFQGEDLIPCEKEEDIFQALGLTFIPPELREGMGEIEVAEQGKLPNLVKAEDFKGVFHIHTQYSDGTASIKSLLEGCKALGWQYMGISDHSQSASYAGGLKLPDLEAQFREIDTLNNEYLDFKIFKGIEVDILSDGSLDYSDEVLARFDFVIASVHSNFRLPKAEQTKRITKALGNPYVTMLGHPTGRILLAREGYELDMEEILKVAQANSIILEINSSPYRLDLDWRWCQKGKEMGIKFALNPDAHSLDQLRDLYWGLGVARKGWLEAEDIINTWATERLLAYFKAKGGGF